MTDNSKASTRGSRLSNSLSDEIRDDLVKLRQPFAVGSIKLDWWAAILSWIDSGTTTEIVKLLNEGKAPPEHALKALAHILAGNPRGVSNRHTDAETKWLNYKRDLVAISLKKKIKEAVTSGEIIKPRGKSFNEMTASEFNKLYKFKYGTITESYVEKLPSSDDFSNR